MGNITHIWDTIGNTPVVKLKRLTSPSCARVLAKLESFNPGGSVKDRIAYSMISDAEDRGLLAPGGAIIEPTSGNTGIGLAMIGAAKGYKVILVMPETMSMERRTLLTAYGAQLVLTPGDLGMSGAIKKAEEIVNENPGYYMPQQFRNPANPEIHRKTTAVEILRQTDSCVDAFVVGVGTGGTLTGVGQVLKERINDVKIIAVEPKNSPVLSGGVAGPHKIQGIGAGFVPQILNTGLIDDIIQVEDEKSLEMTKSLAEKEGIFVGISSGAAAYASIQVAKRLGKDKTVLTILPDTGERYLSILSSN